MAFRPTNSLEQLVEVSEPPSNKHLPSAPNGNNRPSRHPKGKITKISTGHQNLLWISARTSTPLWITQGAGLTSQRGQPLVHGPAHRTHSVRTHLEARKADVRGVRSATHDGIGATVRRLPSRASRQKPGPTERGDLSEVAKINNCPPSINRHKHYQKALTDQTGYRFVGRSPAPVAWPGD